MLPALTLPVSYGSISKDNPPEKRVCKQKIRVCFYQGNSDVAQSSNGQTDVRLPSWLDVSQSLHSDAFKALCGSDYILEKLRELSTIGRPHHVFAAAYMCNDTGSLTDGILAGLMCIGVDPPDKWQASVWDSLPLLLSSDTRQSLRGPTRVMATSSRNLYLVVEDSSFYIAYACTAGSARQEDRKLAGIAKEMLSQCAAYIDVM